MKIVFLDVKTIGEDIDLSGYEKLGEVIKYPFSSTDEVPERVTDADVIILNKVQINEQSIGAAKKLKLVCVTATGTNNLDKDYLDRRGIAWRNVAGYSTDSVAQHTFAMARPGASSGLGISGAGSRPSPKPSGQRSSTPPRPTARPKKGTAKWRRTPFMPPPILSLSMRRLIRIRKI